MNGTLPAAMAAAIVVGVACAQNVTPEFQADYQLENLGSIDGVATPYGGLIFKAGDANTLYIGGAANSLNATLYAVPLTRNPEGRITGFECAEPVELAAVFGDGSGGIDGGLEYAPGNVILYTSYSDNSIGQILPGSVEPDRFIDLGDLGVSSSVGTLRIVPQGFPGAGRLKIASYNASTWYDATISQAKDGTFDIVIDSPAIQLTGGPEGIVYVAAGNPGFDSDSVLISQYSSGAVAAYEIDDNGDPIASTSRQFVASLSGAVSLTRFRGHLDRRECSPGVIHGQAQGHTQEATDLHQRVQG